MQNTIHTIKTVDEIIKQEEDGSKASPLPISVIPNYMGINLCAVHSLEWVKQEDGQLVTLTINFIPNNENQVD